MRVLIDTCIIVDLLQERQPFYGDAKEIFLGAAKDQFEGYISASSVTDIHYLLHKYIHSEEESRNILSKMLELFSILPTLGTDCQNALISDVKDYEDAVMIETAKRENIDCIVTRDLGDYSRSDVKVYSPKAFLKQLYS